MSYRLFAQIGSTGSLPAFTVLVAILAYRGLTGLVPWRLRMDRTGRVPPGCANRTLGAVGSTPRGGRCPEMRTAPAVLIMLVRFGPDLVYAAGDTLPPQDPSRQTTALKWIVSPPAVVVFRAPQ